MQLDERPPEELIRLDHNAAILRLQRRIVEAARERPYLHLSNPRLSLLAPLGKVSLPGPGQPGAASRARRRG